jgi:hypothetical protein
LSATAARSTAAAPVAIVSDAVSPLDSIRHGPKHYLDFFQDIVLDITIVGYGQIAFLKPHLE